MRSNLIPFYATKLFKIETYQMCPELPDSSGPNVTSLTDLIGVGGLSMVCMIAETLSVRLENVTVQ